MALLAPCEKFLTIIEGFIDEKKTASVVVGDVRGDINNNEATYFFSVYYGSPNQVSFPYSDEKEFNALIEKFKRGKLFVGKHLVKNISPPEESYRLNPNLGLLEDVLHEGELSFVDTDGNASYYFLNAHMEVIVSQHEPKIYNGYYDGKFELHETLAVMKLFKESKHPDINVEENIKLRAKIEKEVEKVVIRDLSSTISAYASNF